MNDPNPADLRAELRALSESFERLREREAHRARTRRRLLAGLAGLVLTVPVAAWAASITLPYVFVDGQVARADEVNANFQELLGGVRAGGLGIGTVVASMLSETQFQTEHGTGWVLCDGQTVSGSAYATLTGRSSAPDLTGRFLRGLGGGSGGLGDPQGWTTGSPGSLTASSDGNHQHEIDSNGAYPFGSGTFTIQLGGFAGFAAGNRNLSESNGAHTHPVTGTWATETRPDNVAFNFFVRID